VNEQAATDEARKGNRKPSATIYDIAQATELSPSTVSRALNKPGRISAKTEQRVREAAQRLGYRTNPMARALPTGKTGTLALLVSDLTNPMYFELVGGAERVASAAGHTLVLAESRESAETERATAARLEPAVDGVLLVASRLTDDEITQLAAEKPLVLANRCVPGVPAVVPDVSPGIHQALEHLREAGHHAIGYLSGPPESWLNRERWNALFEQALARDLSIVEIPTATPTMDGGAEGLRRVLASGITAVVAFNDLMALGLLRACRSHGVDVPGRLSVVGFDDIFGADLTTPALTTIRSPLAAIGEAAMHLLLAEVSGDDIPHAAALPTALVLRESTGAPKPRSTSGVEEPGGNAHPAGSP
jgi:LacI family transcriptional regulator